MVLANSIQWGLFLVYLLIIPSASLAKLTYCSFAGVIKLAVFSSILWLLLTILYRSVQSSPLTFILVRICGALFMVLPPVNYMRVLFFIRRHNAQISVALPSQMTTVFHREKKVALDMSIVTVLLFASISPAMSVALLRNQYPGVYSILFPWSLTMASILSSVNPIIYFGRNKNMRSAFKSIMNL